MAPRPCHCPWTRTTRWRDRTTRRGGGRQRASLAHSTTGDRPTCSQARGKQEPAAIEAAGSILRSRGAGDRRFRNMLVFLAADRAVIDSLRQSARKLLAWRSVEDDRQKGILNLDDFQKSLI